MAWAPLLLLLAIAACAPAQPRPASQAAAQPQVAPQVGPTGTPGAATADPPPKQPAAPPGKPEVAPKKPPQPEKTIDLSLLPPPATLVGLTQGEVSAMLGPPDFHRRDDPAEIWQYHHATCMLDLFLYKDAGGSILTVAHVEVRGPGSAQPASGKFAGRKCLFELKQDREKEKTG